MRLLLEDIGYSLGASNSEFSRILRRCPAIFKTEFWAEHVTQGVRFIGCELTRRRNWVKSHRDHWAEFWLLTLWKKSPRQNCIFESNPTKSFASYSNSKQKLKIWNKWLNVDLITKFKIRIRYGKVNLVQQILSTKIRRFYGKPSFNLLKLTHCRYKLKIFC